jgi:hypothetical protein
MARLYIPPLPNADAQTTDEGVRAAIQSAGLIQEGGVATEKIATDNIDVTVDGQFRWGKLFNDKLARELESLSESAYSGVPLFDTERADLGRNKGYYELELVDVSPAHPKRDEGFEYTAGLTFSGTQETHWRAVQTNEEAIQTGLATGSDGGSVGVPTSAGKVKWYDTATGKEPATPAATFTAEFGDVDVYDPTNATATDPTLLYEVAYEDESPVDVRVFDDRGKDKFYELTSNNESVSINQWTHVFHPAFEFEGRPVIENGLIRLIIDEVAGEIEYFEWDTSLNDWESITPLDFGTFTFIDADIERIGPAMTDIFCEFENDSGGIEEAILSVQRGEPRGAVVRETDNGTLSSGLETELDPLASDQTTDVQPEQTLKSRDEVK